MTMMSGAQMLVRTLEELGVEILFGYPGGAVLDIYDALLDSTTIRHVLARHEQGGAHMADGYARATGRTGCCLVTSGPGSTNTVTSIATAYMDSVPLVVITGQVISPLIGSDAFQEVDTVGITRPIVKHSYLCKNALDIPVYLARAFYLAASGRPGPVVVDVPKDCVSPANTFRWPGLPQVRLRSYNPTLMGHKGQIRRACKLLAAARRPLLLAGGGVILGNAAEEFRALAHRLGMPVTTTLMGLGSIDGSDPLCTGMVGMHGTLESNEAMDKCDVLLAVGVRFDDRVTNDTSKFCPTARIIHIDIDPASIDKTVHAHVPIVGAVREVLGQFQQALDELGFDGQHADLSEWWKQIEAWRGRHCLSYHSHGETIAPQAIVEAIYKFTQGEAIITTDVGQHQMFAALYYHYHHPRTFITSGGLGTMGFGFPAGAGAKLGCPGREVCVLTGDGSIQMNIQELGTCFEYHIPLKIFIFNNHTLGMVRQWQQLFYKGRISATNLDYNPDFVALARAYGHEGLRVTKPEELEGAVQQALAMHDRLVLVDIVCDIDAHVLPMQQPRGSMADMFLSED